MGYDPEGNRVNCQDQTLDIALKPKQFAGIMANGLHARMFLDMPLGPGFLRIGICDGTTDRVGAVELPVAAVAKLSPVAIPAAAQHR